MTHSSVRQLRRLHTIQRFPTASKPQHRSRISNGRMCTAVTCSCLLRIMLQASGTC